MVDTARCIHVFILATYYKPTPLSTFTKQNSLPTYSMVDTARCIHVFIRATSMVRVQGVVQGVAQGVVEGTIECVLLL